MTLLETVRAFQPGCEQEAADRRLMLRYMELFPQLLTRENETAHFTASCWITTPDQSRVLMAYHKLFDSWAWLGGHADGEEDLLAVALREAREESGLHTVRAAADRPLSLEILAVHPHEKRGKFVPAHLHLNLTYLLEADPAQPLRCKPDENAGVRWFTPWEAVQAAREASMRPIYRKLIDRVALYY